MSESDEEIEIIDESEQQEKVAANTEQFEPNSFMGKLIEFLDSSDKDAPERMKFLVAQTWARPADTNFFSDAFPLDAGGVSKVPPNMMMAGAKRIAGTQRLLYTPAPPMKKSASASASAEAEKAGLTKKVKKQVPVIDDSIYCTTDQPCQACGLVSQAGNQVLICKKCRDCFHMRCSQPPVSVEEASNPNFLYLCRTCLISRKVMESGRSRSPSPANMEKKRVMTRL